MWRGDLPDVLILGQQDPSLRAMGKAAEDYLESLLASAPYFGTVFTRGDLIDAFTIQRVDRKRFTLLCFVFRDLKAGQNLIENRLARLTERRRFADLRLQLTPENAALLAWAARKGVLIRSCGRDSNTVTVTLSRPRVSREEAHQGASR